MRINCTMIPNISWLTTASAVEKGAVPNLGYYGKDGIERKLVNVDGVVDWKKLSPKLAAAASIGAVESE